MENKNQSLPSRQPHPATRRTLQMSQWEVVLLCAIVEIRHQLAEGRAKSPQEDHAG